MQKYQRYIEIVGNVHASHLENTLDNEKIEVHLRLLTLSAVSIVVTNASRRKGTHQMN
jgi:hypothetical protein